MMESSYRWHIIVMVGILIFNINKYSACLQTCTGPRGYREYPYGPPFDNLYYVLYTSDT